MSLKPSESSAVVWLVIVGLVLAAAFWPGGGGDNGKPYVPPGGKISVAMFHDPEQDGVLPKEQLTAIHSLKLRNTLQRLCEVGESGQPEWRLFTPTDDVSRLSKKWRDIYSRPRDGLPWIVVSNGKDGAEGYFPPDEDEAVKLVAEYAGSTLEEMSGVPRSGRWPAVRKAYLRKHPYCEFRGCKNRDTPEIHHIEPFHLRPDLELVESNLIALCRTGENHHLYAGHLGRFTDINPNVREDCRNGVIPEKSAERKRHHDEKLAFYRAATEQFASAFGLVARLGVCVFSIPALCAL